MARQRTVQERRAWYAERDEWAYYHGDDRLHEERYYQAAPIDWDDELDSYRSHEAAWYAWQANNMTGTLERIYHFMLRPELLVDYEGRHLPLDSTLYHLEPLEHIPHIERFEVLNFTTLGGHEPVEHYLSSGGRHFLTQDIPYHLFLIRDQHTREAGLLMLSVLCDRWLMTRARGFFLDDRSGRPALPGPAGRAPPHPARTQPGPAGANLKDLPREIEQSL
jgi:hypothetical protein